MTNTITQTLNATTKRPTSCTDRCFDVESFDRAYAPKAAFIAETEAPKAAEEDKPRGTGP